MTAFMMATVPAEANTLPGRYYASEQVFRAETKRIFYRGWVCVGRAEQIARPGDYFLTQLVGESLIVVRGRDGVARAFFNVCRHRGTRICTAEQGRFAGSTRRSWRPCSTRSATRTRPGSRPSRPGPARR